MGKRLSRVYLTGKPLDEDCKTAHTTTHEFGIHDDRTFCYGLMHSHNHEYYDKCKDCKAFVDNAEPLEGGGLDE